MVTELVVHRIVAGGTGLAEHDGLKVFIPYAAPEERVRARLVERKRDYAVARIEEILEPSPLRVEAPCPFYGRCGGCQLQHITYEGQLVVKKLIVNDALQRIGGVYVPVRNIRPSSPHWRYRNKTQYPVGRNGTLKVGFYRRGSHDIVDVAACLLHPEPFDDLRRTALDALAASGETVYDEQTHSGNVRHIILRHDGAGHVLAVVATRTSSVAPALVEALSAAPGVTGVVQTVNPERTNRILGQPARVLTGSGHLVLEVLDRRLRVSADSFCQVNSAGAAELCRKVLKHVAPRGNETVLDLYCGIGMLGIVLARFVRRVIGVELAPSAVTDAWFNSELNAAPNVEFIQGEVESIAPALPKADVVVLDPPRKGCDRETLHRVAGLGPRTIVYVSCNPATLARDLKSMEADGYAVTDVEPVDMFPQTHHVETVVRLARAT